MTLSPDARSAGLLDDVSCAVAWEKDGEWPSNAWMAATAGHPFIRLVLDLLPDRIDARAAQSINEQTGPHLLAEAHRHYRGGDVTMFPSAMFMPFDFNHRNPDGEYPRRLCDPSLGPSDPRRRALDRHGGARMTTRYLDVDTFKQWTNDDVDDDDDLIEQAIQAAEQWLDHQARRRFIKADESTARSFVPEAGSTLLFIGDCDTIASVTENGTALTEGTHYQPEPIDKIDPVTGEYRPYDRLRRLDAVWYRNGPRATVVVNAAWGWEETPRRGDRGLPVPREPLAREP